MIAVCLVSFPRYSVLDFTKLDVRHSCMYREMPGNNNLIIRDLFERHNHECSQRIYSGYPEVRGLSKQSVKTATDSLRCSVKPTLSRPLLREQEGDKIILSSDISNMRYM